MGYLWGYCEMGTYEAYFQYYLLCSNAFMYNMFHRLRGKKTFIVKNWATNKSNIVT